MFEEIKNTMDDSKKENSLRNMSLDFKLMFVYHIAMMVLFGARPIDNANGQILFAMTLGAILIVVSVFHKVKHNWSWPGIKAMSIPGALFNLIFLYVFFAFTAYAMNPDIPAPAFQISNIVVLATDAWPVIKQAILIPIYTP